MKITVTVCDMCGQKGKPTRPYRISDQAVGQVPSVDLCADDALPVEEILAARAKAQDKPKARRRRAKAGVTSMEEVEARKG